jgi:hypothetical protein
MYGPLLGKTILRNPRFQLNYLEQKDSPMSCGKGVGIKEKQREIAWTIKISKQHREKNVRPKSR